MSNARQPKNETKSTPENGAPKRMGKRTAEESRRTRRALIDAAIVEFSEQGMNGARIDEIAERAGVTKGAVYTHFDNRDSLIVEACRSAIRSLELTRVASEAADLVTFTNEAAKLLIAPAAKPARMLISELYASAMRSEAIATLLAEWHADFVETVRDRVPAGLESPEAIAVALNFLNVALCHIDLYESMHVSHDELLAIVSRLAAELLSANS